MKHGPEELPPGVECHGDSAEGKHLHTRDVVKQRNIVSIEIEDLSEATRAEVIEHGIIDTRSEYQRVRDELRDHLEDAAAALEQGEWDEEDAEYRRGLAAYLEQAHTLSTTRTDRERIAELSDRIDTLALQRRLLYDDVLDPERNTKLHQLADEIDGLVTEYTELRALVRIATDDSKD